MVPLELPVAPMMLECWKVQIYNHKYIKYKYKNILSTQIIPGRTIYLKYSEEVPFLRVSVFPGFNKKLCSAPVVTENACPNVFYIENPRANYIILSMSQCHVLCCLAFASLEMILVGPDGN